MGEDRTTCKRCGIEFEDSNPAVPCGECDRPTLCVACAEDHACCMPDECLKCDAKTTLICQNCPHGPKRESAWLLKCKREAK